MLILEGAQAGLFWPTIINCEENYRKAFDGFDPRIVAAYDDQKIEELLKYKGIIRNRRKIEAAVSNARTFLKIQEEFGSFDRYMPVGMGDTERSSVFMTRKKKVKILFIGNSHTYYHDLPAWVVLMAKEEGYECDVTMLAHGGWYLHQHVEEPDVRFNIRFGHYDYVVLQEHSHPFDDIPGYIKAATILVSWIREAGSTPVIYGTWAMKAEKSVQATMNNVNRKLAEDLDAVYASVGESWWSYKDSWPDIEMYDEDGAHASEHGIEFAAKIIWSTIRAAYAADSSC